METVSAERDALKENMVKLTEEKQMLIVESEDTAQKLEKQHETKLRYDREQTAFRFLALRSCIMLLVLVFLFQHYVFCTYEET